MSNVLIIMLTSKLLNDILWFKKAKLHRSAEQKALVKKTST
jgi:hypothetical protein